MLASIWGSRILDYLLSPNIYRTRLTHYVSIKALFLVKEISKVSSFRVPKLLAKCLISALAAPYVFPDIKQSGCYYCPASGDLDAYSEGIDVLHDAVLTKDKRLVVAAMLLNNTFCCCYQALTKFTIKFSFTHTIILCSYSLSVPKSLYQIFEVAYWVSSEQ